MSNWKIPITVDLTAPWQRPRALPEPLMLVGDDHGHELRVTVREGGRPATLSGVAYGVFTRVDGVQVQCPGAVDGDTVTVAMSAECYACTGQLRAVVRFLDGDGRLCTLVDALMWVAEGVTDDPVEGSELPIADYTELYDLRRGASGAVYGSAGDAVRTEMRMAMYAASAAQAAVSGKVNKPAVAGRAWQALVTLGGDETAWATVGQPTDQQVDAALADYLEAHPLSIEHRGYVTPEMFGAVGDGVTDDSTAVQAAVDSGYNVRFLSRVYRFKNVVISRDIVIEGVGATLTPLGVTEASNQFINMFISQGADVVYRRLNFVGLGAALLQTVDTQSLIRAEGGSVRLYGCRFSHLYTVNTPAAKVVDRFANVLFAVGCDDAVEIVGCTFTALGGEEIVYVTPGAETPLVRRCRFAHNVVRDVSGYSFNLFAEQLEIVDNYVSGFRGPVNQLATTIFNCWANNALCQGNVVVDSDPRDVFDFAEQYAPASGYCGTMLRGYTVRIQDNVADIEGGIFAICVGERVALERNRVRGGALYLGYCTNGPVANSPAAMQPTAILDAEQARIVGNTFVYRASSKAEALAIRAAIEPYNAGYAASAVYEGRQQLRRCEIRDNELRFPDADGPAIPAVQLDTMIEHCWITGNTIRNPGLVGGLRSADMRLAVKVNATWGGATMRLLSVAGNTIHSADTESLLETVAVVCTLSSATSQYGFDLANDVAVVDLDAEGNTYDREHTAATIYGTTPPMVTRMTKFDLTPAVSATLINGKGVYYRGTNTVRLYLRINNDTELNGTLFTVPEGYRPGATRSGLYGALSVTGTGGLLACGMVVGADGSVSVHAGETVHVAKLTGCIEYAL